MSLLSVLHFASSRTRTSSPYVVYDYFLGEGGGKARRYSRLVFIGLGIDREPLETGFLACCAK
jgi:hypothetical protein